MFRLSLSSRLSAIIVLTAAVSACTGNVTTTGGKKPAGPSGAAAQAVVDVRAPVTIALLAPSSAENAGAARLGQALGNAARMAASDLGDPLLNLRIYNTGGNAGQARTAAEQALRDGAKLIAGPLFGANTKAIASAAAGANVKVLSFSTDASVAGGPVYLSGFLPEVAAKRITSFARGQGYGSIGVFYPNNPYGAAAIRGAQTGGGTAIVTSTAYERTNEGLPPGAQTFAAGLKQSGANAAVLAESGQALKYVASLMKQNGISGRNIKFLGLGEWNARATLDGSDLKGGWFAAPDPAAMSAFVERYQSAYGSVPPPLAVLGYDAVRIAGQLLADARRNGSGDPFAASALTRPQGFRGIVGPIRFSPDGLGERGMAILEVRDRDFRTVDPTPPAFGLGS